MTNSSSFIMNDTNKSRISKYPLFPLYRTCSQTAALRHRKELDYSRGLM